MQHFVVGTDSNQQHRTVWYFVGKLKSVECVIRGTYAGVDGCLKNEFFWGGLALAEDSRYQHPQHQR